LFDWVEYHFRHLGGIWTAPSEYKFGYLDEEEENRTSVVLDEKFGSWPSTQDGSGVGFFMPTLDKKKQ
jgi:hypothetical protein